MLFALRLNGANVSAGDDPTTNNGSGLSVYEIGDVVVHFHEDAARQALLILFVHASVGRDAAGFLAAELVRHFDRNSAVEPSKNPYKRQLVAAALRAALCALPEWVLQQMVEASRPAVTAGGVGSSGSNAGLTIVVEGLAALRSAALCDALSPSPIAVDVPSKVAPRIESDGANASAAELARLLGVEATARPPSPAPSRAGGCLGCFLRRAETTRGTGRAARGTARRPAPHPSPLPPPSPAPPPLAWLDELESNDSATAAASSGSGSSNGSSSGSSSGSSNSDGGGGDHSSRRLLLIDELQLACRHRLSHVVGARWVAARPSSTGSSGKGGAVDEARRGPVGSVVVLLRSPLLLRARVAWHSTGDRSAAGDATKEPPASAQREPPLPLHDSSPPPSEDANECGAIAALAAALHPWLAALALGMTATSATIA